MPASDRTVLVRPGREEVTLFCIPGAFGGIEGFAALARRIGAEIPVVAILPPEVTDSRPRFTVEELAAETQREIRKIQPGGPYHLLGACFGGIVAFETAKLLRAAGAEVAALALVDAYNPAWADGLPSSAAAWLRVRYLLERAGYHLGNLRRLGLSGASSYLEPRFRARAEAGRRRRGLAEYRRLAGRGESLPAACRDVQYASWDAASRYVPGIYDGPLTLFQVTEPRDGGTAAPLMGWARAAGGPVELHRLDGDHEGAFEEPSISRIADVISRALRGGTGDPRP
jgi:thioesterase domain-containing protein